MECACRMGVESFSQTAHTDKVGPKAFRLIKSPSLLTVFKLLIVVPMLLVFLSLIIIFMMTAVLNLPVHASTPNRASLHPTFYSSSWSTILFARVSRH